jgi:hypothetical protein
MSAIMSTGEEEEENYFIKREDNEIQYLEAWKKAWERGNGGTRSR